MITDFRKTLGQLIIDTRVKLDDMAGERWTDAEVIEAINDACLDFVLRTRAIIKRFTLQLLENQQVYDVKYENDHSASMEKYFGYPIRFEYADAAVTTPAPGRWEGMTPIEYSVPDFYRLSMTVTGLPKYMSMNLLSPGKIEIIYPPREDGAGATTEKNLMCWFVGMPDYVSNTASYLDSIINPLYHQAIPPGAAARLLAEGNEDDLDAAIACEAESMQRYGKAVSDSYRAGGMYASLAPR